MALRELGRRIVPLGLATALLLITLAAASSAGAGVSAQTVSSACTYSLCPNPSNSSPFTAFTVGAVLGLLLLVAVILGILIFRDRRRGGPKPPAPWSDAAVA